MASTTNQNSNNVGLPLSLEILVIDTNCKPLSGVWLDLWQADASGNYSGYRGGSGAILANGACLLVNKASASRGDLWSGYGGGEQHAHMEDKAHHYECL